VDTRAEDDTIGDFDIRNDGGEEVPLPIRSMSLTAGVGDIGRTVDGVADRAVVGGTDEPRAAIAGFETVAADSEARGLATEDFLSAESGAGWEAKAEVRSAVIRSYIRLGLVVAGWEDLLAVDGEDETGFLALVALAASRSGVVVAEGLVETLTGGFWVLTAVCLLFNNPPEVVVGVELC
jgi:hypothetical protein